MQKLSLWQFVLCIAAVLQLSAAGKTAAVAPSSSLPAARARPAASGRSVDVAQLVGTMLGRATSTSQVLTLNITNLVILLVVKAMIIAGGFLVFGGSGLNPFASDGAAGRSSGTSSSGWLDRDDMLLMLTYLQGDSVGDYTCLMRVACEKPGHTADYIRAAKLMLTAANFAEGLISVDRKYRKLVGRLQTAVHHGLREGVCSLRYPCHSA